ncbi:MAG: 5-formyltetrahydrofolate cyclo-ligase [Elusimicrobia bacterium]|nr:5-formyltetrahydrofolate cyclo-ligase [Elusimicrobiota bacterium]
MNGFLAGDEKVRLRQTIKSKRDALSDKERAYLSSEITRRLISLPVYESAKTIVAYCSHGSEVMTDDFIIHAFADGKRVAVPKVAAKESGVMQVMCIRSLDDVSPGVFNIREPHTSPDCEVLAIDEIDVVLVPGMVFDPHGSRIGYGKGFYDRWMGALPAQKLVGLAYDFQVLENVPSEKNDVTVGLIVTNTRIISCDERSFK